MTDALKQAMDAISDKIVHHEKLSKDYSRDETFRNNEVFISVGLRKALECCYEVRREMKARKD